VEELKEITKRLSAPQVANMVVGGKTPLINQKDLFDLGYSIVLYANTPLQAAMRAMSNVLKSLKETGDVSEVIDSLSDFAERQRLVAKFEYDAAEKKYSSD
jgi:2-methylisocitrate lyase-like PEP mutase family enzyme